MRSIPLILCLLIVGCRTTDPSTSEFASESAAVVAWPVLDKTKFAEYQCKPATKSWSNDVAQLNAAIVRYPVPESATADAIIDVWYYKIGGFQQTPMTDLSCAMKQDTENMFSYDCVSDGAGIPKSVLVLDLAKIPDADGSLALSVFDVGQEAADSPLGVSRNRDTERKLRCMPYLFPRKVGS